MNDSSFRNVFYGMMTYLQSESPEAKKLKSALRHAVAEEPGNNPELWGWIVSQMPPELQGKEEQISYAEYAVYISLSMFAIGPGNNNEMTFAEAIAASESGRRRLVDSETASDMNDMQVALRGAVSLLASKAYSFSYCRLAEDIYSWQINKTKIARKWEREYARKETK